MKCKRYVLTLSIYQILLFGDDTCCIQSIYQLTDGRILGVGSIDNNIYIRNSLNNPWKGHIENSCCVREAIQMPDGSIVGVGRYDNRLYKRTSLESNWTGPIGPGVFNAIEATSDGKLLHSDFYNGLYLVNNLEDDANNWVFLVHNGNIPLITCIRLTNDGKLVGVGNDNHIYIRDNLSANGKWQGPIPNSCCVISIAFLK